MVRRAIVGTLLGEDGTPFRGEVVIEDGRIVEVTEAVGAADVERRDDYGTAFVLPGVIDSHVHCLSDGSEGITAATTAAAAGGVTTIIEMPFDGAGPINSLERLLAKIEAVKTEAMVDVALLGTVVPDGGWSEIAPMVEAGAIGFKVSTFNTDSVRFPRSTIPQFREIMKAIAAADSIVCVHAESDEVIRPLLEDDENRASEDPLVHGRTRPPVAEELGVMQVIATANEAGARAHLCHLSLSQTVRLAQLYRDAFGTDVTVETCPHYLVFDEEDVSRQRGRLKINPPIRPRDQVEALWELLGDGGIDIVSSDHAPWSVDKKIKPVMLSNSSGVPGVETMAASVLSEAHRRGPDVFAAAVRALTVAPAERFGLAASKGRLAPGLDADIAVFDPADPWTIDENELHSNAGWSPYHGLTTSGRIVRTIARGVDIWDGAEVLAAPGDGRFITPVRGDESA